MAKRPPFSRRGEQAIQAFQEAGQLDAITRLVADAEYVKDRETKD